MLILVICYLGALGTDAFCNAVIAYYLRSVPDKGARLLALAAAASSLEAGVMFVTVFFYRGSYAASVAPILIRVVFRILKALALLPATAHFIARNKPTEVR
jgi:hypothetical protein